MFLSTFHLNWRTYSTYVDEITIPAFILCKNVRILNFMVKREIWSHQNTRSHFFLHYKTSFMSGSASSH